MILLKLMGNKLITVLAVFALIGPTISAEMNKMTSTFKEHTKKSIVIKLATLAPNGSPWHEILKDMAHAWSKASDGLVTLRIYPGSVAGDEPQMVRKLRIGQLQAAAITNNGLSRIAPEVNVLTIPMLVSSWEELDRLRDVLAPRLEALLEENGFVVLNWGDGSWVRFFVTTSDPSVDVVKKKSKLFVWSGDDASIEIWKASGFQVVPLAATDILIGLQIGIINAFNTTPIMALASQWFPFAPYMIDMPWAPLICATVIDRRTWEKIPESLRPQLKKIAKETGERLTSEIRRMEGEAIVEMQKRWLTILKPTEEQIKDWSTVIEAAYPKIRGSLVPESWFDDALQVAAKMSMTNEH